MPFKCSSPREYATVASLTVCLSVVVAVAVAAATVAAASVAAVVAVVAVAAVDIVINDSGLTTDGNHLSRFRSSARQQQQ